VRSVSQPSPACRAFLGRNDNQQVPILIKNFAGQAGRGGENIVRKRNRLKGTDREIQRKAVFAGGGNQFAADRVEMHLRDARVDEMVQDECRSQRSMAAEIDFPARCEPF
jgi:hypothetical protein